MILSKESLLVHLLSEIMHELTCSMHLILATVLPILSGALSHFKPFYSPAA